jgi:hypothetical protein
MTSRGTPENMSLIQRMENNIKKKTRSSLFKKLSFWVGNFCENLSIFTTFRWKVKEKISKMLM